jgi:hypothetical protein
MRAEDARALLENEALKEAFQIVRDRCHRSFEAVDVRNMEEMQVIRIKLDIIHEVYTVLAKVLNDEVMKRHTT